MPQTNAEYSSAANKKSGLEPTVPAPNKDIKLPDCLQLLDEWLATNGWVAWRVSKPLDDFDYAWFKRHPLPKGVPDCFQNANKPGIQVGLQCYVHRPTDGEKFLGFTVNLRAKCNDGSWVDLNSYGCDEKTIKTKLNRQCRKLLSAWAACN